jgi:hypothetical protein
MIFDKLLFTVKPFEYRDPMNKSRKVSYQGGVRRIIPLSRIQLNSMVQRIPVDVVYELSKVFIGPHKFSFKRKHEKLAHPLVSDIERLGI